MGWLGDNHGHLSYQEIDNIKKATRIVADELRYNAPVKPSSVAERQAKKDALIKQRWAERKEEAAARREAETARQEAFARATQSHYYTPPMVDITDMPTQQKMAVLDKQAAEFRAHKAQHTPYGSPEYLHARYGYNYTLKLKTVVEVLGCSEEEAAQHLARTYNEEAWKELESDLVEQLLGNR